MSVRDPNVGIVMAGGKSRRMGRDKALLRINGTLLVQIQYELLSKFCDRVHVSCAKNQEPLFKDFDLVVDRYKDIGPIGGLATAFDNFPGQSILVLAVDMAAVDEEVISKLTAARDFTKDASVVRGKQSQYPQPLVAIYEPSSARYLKEQLKDKQFAMHRLLSSMRTHKVDVDDSFLINVNSKDELGQIEGLE